jgi:arylsulfatase A-like enzyme
MSQRPPNVLLLCADDHRADAFGAFDSAIQTPHLDVLRQRGADFSRVYTSVPLCNSARAELLSGCSAWRTGVRWFCEPLDPSYLLLPHAFSRAGHATFYTGKWHNNGSPDLFYEYTRHTLCGGMSLHHIGCDTPDGQVFGDSSELFTEAAVEFLQSDTARERPWLCHVAFTAPHDPRTSPRELRPDPHEITLPPNFMPEHPFDNGDMTIRDECITGWPRTPAAIQEQRADYYGMVAHLDRCVGRILEALEASGQAENTYVVYVSDHGLAVGSHGLMGKENVYEHSIRVPLLIAGPGIPAGKEYSVLCQALDLYATLCELCHIAVPEGLDSRSLLPTLSGLGLDSVHRDAVFCAYHKQRAVVTPRWKLIKYSHLDRRQLFDLKNDPFECSDLLQTWRDFSDDPTGQTAAQMQNIASHLQQHLTEFLAAQEIPLRTVEDR